jgi:tetratricopeptide (TPR) repeat protein
MTNPRHDEALVRAFELIEEGHLADARDLIQSVLDDDEQNADAWWIYAHAVEDRTDAIRALNKVADIDPEYDGLSELLAHYNQDVPAELEEYYSVDDDPADSLDTFDDDFDFDNVDVEPVTEQPIIAEPQEKVWPRRIVILTVILLLVMVGYLIWNSSRSKDEPVIAGVPTEDTMILLPDENEPVEETTPEIIDIDAIPEESFDESLSTSEISLILGDYQLANEEFVFVESGLGQTQTINLCQDQNESLRDTILNTLMAFSSNLGLIELDTQAIAIRILECETQEVLSFIGVSVDNVNLYDSGEISDAEFMGTWTVLD